MQTKIECTYAFCFPDDTVFIAMYPVVMLSSVSGRYKDFRAREKFKI